MKTNDFFMLDNHVVRKREYGFCFKMLAITRRKCWVVNVILKINGNLYSKKDGSEKIL